MTLDEAAELSKSKGVDLPALDDALNELSRMSARQSRIVELRFFGGLSIEETTEFLGSLVGQDRALVGGSACVILSPVQKDGTR